MKEYYKDLKLDKFQKEAIEAIHQGENVIVAAPTGSGKTLIAEYAIERCIAEGKKIIYTSPIKALSNQKFRDFSNLYGPLIGIMTGDVTINPDAQVMIMTTEVFRNTIFEDAKRLEHIYYVIFDEIHYMDNLERGTVWEESIIFAPEHIRFLALSATISNLREFSDWIEEVRKSRVKVVMENSRPVPLRHFLLLDGKEWMEKKDLDKYRKDFKKKSKNKKDKETVSFLDVHNALIERLATLKHTPCIYFLFSRAACEKMAHRAAMQNFFSPEEQKQMSTFIGETMKDLAFTDEEAEHTRSVIRLLMHGVCYHHAGLLPMLKELVERCFSSGLVKLLFATETFALGVNMPAKSVVFETLRKFNGIREVYIKARQYQQMAGRAGRRGIDDEGYIYSSVLSQKDMFKNVQQVVSGRAEPISSRFNLDYSTLLNLYKRLGDNFFEAWEKSFATFKTQHQGRKPHWYQNMLYQVETKFEVLKRTGYIENNIIQEKGEFALKIAGYEIHLTELYSHGVLSMMDPVQLNILFSAIVFEGRSDHFAAKQPSSLPAKVRKKAQHVLKVFFRTERGLGILSPIKELDFAMACATDLWSQGYSLGEIDERVPFSPGDIVRNLRRTVQVLKQFEKALEKEEQGDIYVLEKIKEAISLLKRDMVDAEAQLRRGLHNPDETAIAAALRKAGLIVD